MRTNFESFEIRNSLIEGAGKGVFAKIDITEGTYLYFKSPGTTIGVIRHVSEIPRKFIGYCIAQEGEMYLCPADFKDIECIWYLNHSANPNAERREDGYYSKSLIREGDKITIDYNTLGEPEDKKEGFYRKS